jgi:hypothetical protein
MKAGLALLMFFAASLQADAAEVHRMKRKAVSGKEILVGVATRWGKECRSIGVPEVRLDAAPDHGFVCIRTGLVTPTNLLFGRDDARCLRTPMSGVQIVYQSRLGFAGSDSVGYTLRFPRGDRPIVVDINVAPAATMPKQASPMFERQPQGPMPECVALVS